MIVVNKLDSAEPWAVAQVLADVAAVNPEASIVRADSPVTLAEGPSLEGKRVLVVEDGPTITHGGMPYGAGFVAAEQGGAAEIVDPRPFAIGSIAQAFERFPHIGHVLPALGYSPEQLDELRRTIDACRCRRRRHRDADRPDAADRLEAPDPPCHVRAAGGRRADARGRARADRRPSPRCAGDALGS